MYLKFFGLEEAPFAITPDPAFVFLSQRHRDALAHLLFGVGQGGSSGFVQLTGEVGTGKTTLCRCLLEQVPASTHIALVLNPLLNPLELLAVICEELGLSTAGAENSAKRLVDLLTAFLLAAHGRGERVVVVVDEAQNLSPEALEQVRLLTNLETSKQKLLQIILLGQPELRDLLRRPSLRQLAQRITARYHLTPLDRAETASYVQHRLEVAGADRNPFTAGALRALYQRSRGVPRLINIIADRALVGAFAREQAQVNARLVHAAANEVQLGAGELRPRSGRALLAGSLALLLLVSAVAAWWWQAVRKPALENPVASTGANTGPASVVTGAENRIENAGSSSGENIVVPQAESTSQPVPEPELTGPEAAVPEPAPAQPKDLSADWLAGQDLQAWAGMAELWGATGDEALIESSCRGVNGLGYACLAEQGNWSRVEALGLPVVLVLRGDPDQHLLLRGAAAGNLLLGVPPQSRSVPREALDQRWFGDYLVSWPQAANWPQQLRRGDSGAAVERVLELASRTDPPYRGTGGFDAAFETWLRGFQARNGLRADGIVGPQTLLYLMRPSFTEPRLLSEWPMPDLRMSDLPRDP